MTEPATKRVNLALQGGGAHGAFAWGVLDRLLRDGRVEIEAISGTSAGSMNAVVCAYGLQKGGPEEACARLKSFWKAIHRAGRVWSPIQRMPWEHHMAGFQPSAAAFETFMSMARFFSPYQLNPFDFNPLRSVLEQEVDFEELHRCERINLFIAATNVRTGKIRIFGQEELSSDVILASACLPYMFKAVEVDGEFYWDGGYSANPALFPFHGRSSVRDIIIVHINPMERPAPPVEAGSIFNRLNEINFNSALLAELRAIHFVQRLLANGWIKDEFRDKLNYMLIHSIRADVALSDLTVASKFDNDWSFLKMLRNRGRSAAKEWLSRHFDDLGVRQTVDLQREFLGIID